MSLTTRSLRASGGGGSGSALFVHEVRREGMVVARLEGRSQPDGSVVVDATVTPVGKGPDAAIARPFTFQHAEHARHFVDEALESLEYLGCDVVS
jgi:hypothetical protein